MTIALDLGASQFRTLRRVDERLIARTASAIYSVLEDTPVHRRLLDQAGLSYSLSEGNIVLLGDAATDSASLFRVPCRHLLPGGRVPTRDPLARQLIGTMIEAVLPTAAAGREICCLTLASGLELEAGSSHADAGFFSRIVRLQGYEPKFVPSSQALVLAELLDASFTGVGLVFGASGCEALLAHRGQPLCHVQTDFGGHAIDERLRQRGLIKPAPTPNDPASATDIVDAITVERFRKTIVPSDGSSTASISHVVTQLLRRACEKLIAAFDSELRRTPRAASVPQPVAVVCSGGLSPTFGFDAILADVLSQCELPVDCLAPRIAEPSARSILRGLLISAELEAPSGAAYKAA
ncbi:hypothetical protein GC176_05795 [bacterium]|nr:hypothetical protein [bacterium]